MFKVSNYKIIAEDQEKYLSFPDIIQSRKDSNKLFLVYRSSSEAHHPIHSGLHFLISEDKGETWEETQKFDISIPKHGCVWNCPRLSYLPNGALSIICDTKSSQREVESEFKIYMLKSYDDGNNFAEINETPLKGMVPDKIIKYKNILLCANHRIKNKANELIQLVNWSRDRGNNWYDCNILAHNRKHDFCEASIVNNNNKNLIAYLRDNRERQRPVYKTTSEDGIHWTNPIELPFWGHRVTAIKDRDKIIGVFRDTVEAKLSMFVHPVNNNSNRKIEKYYLDKEQFENMYHFGYSGIVKIDKDKYLVVYYIKNDKINPFIKSCIVNL